MSDIFNYHHPFVCTDAVIFTIKSLESNSYRRLPLTRLSILLYKRDNNPFIDKWSLPGGFLNIDEKPEESIKRKLYEKSAFRSDCYLEQIYTFCDVLRDPRARVISITYLGLISERESKKLEDNTNWFNVEFDAEELIFMNGETKVNKDDLAFDHYIIIKTAINKLINHTSCLIFHLLPEKFTLTEFQNAYETIKNKKEITANFRRKYIDLLDETNEFTSDKGHRPAKLFIKKDRKKEML